MGSWHWFLFPCFIAVSLPNNAMSFHLG
uniref:Uncharacterized protein n=1 Tax=Rhizophora mucronata TaxID=61149 RepID=A0A2P2QQS5_RHIMU